MTAQWRADALNVNSATVREDPGASAARVVMTLAAPALIKSTSLGVY